MDGSSALPDHVVLVLVDLAGGGTQKVVAGLAEALLDAGTAVTIITNPTDDDRWATLSDRARIVELSGRVTTSELSGLPPVRANLRWLRRAVLDLRMTVRSTGPSTPILAFLPGTNMLTALACLGMRRRLVLSERNDLTRQRLSPPMRLARRVLYRTATTVTTNRTEDRAALQRLAGRVPVHVVRNPPPQVGGPSKPAESRTILCAGRLTRHKRHRDIIAAFAEVAGACPEWTLRILGDGPERPALSRQAHDLGIEDRVELPGWSTDVPSELAAAALFVHASEYEGVSNSVLEAMAAGLPVLVSDTSSPFTAARPGSFDAVTVFPVGAVDHLTAAMQASVADGAVRERHGHAARELAMKLVGLPLDEWAPVLRRCAAR